ncbi:sensor histidine kinase [Brevibacterium senegalense]|uniref:sensor histidine kinase n=1 Tax=Brevibacterium senegalense TaxID=1033736 RepID=UPI0002DABBB9|nr:histidine kinase [Brevibacterium senegalense]
MDATETTPRSRALGILFAVAVANAVLFLALWGETTGWSGDRGGAYLAVAVAFAVSFGVLTLVRDRIPRTALVLAALAVCAYYTVGLPSIGVILPLLVILTAVTLAGHRTFALVTAGLLFVVASFFRIRGGDSAEAVLGYELLSNLVLVALAVALAEVIRTRRALQASRADAERMAAQAALARAQRVQEEDRTRIARALRDDLGHSLAIVSLHANAVLEQVPDDHPAGVSARHLREAASRSLDQLRSAVRAVGSPARIRTGAEAVAESADDEGLAGDPGSARDAQGAGAAHDSSLEQSLAGLDALLDRIRAGGVSVDLVRDHGPLPPSVDAAAVRIVREATTNALRHAQPDHIGLALTQSRGPGSTGDAAGELRIRVLNDGVSGDAGVLGDTGVSPETRVSRETGVSETAGVSGQTGGTLPGSTGLRSLRDHAGSLGGSLTWGRKQPDLFVVDAALPVESPRPTDLAHPAAPDGRDLPADAGDLP